MLIPFFKGMTIKKTHQKKVSLIKGDARRAEGFTSTGNRQLFAFPLREAF